MADRILHSVARMTRVAEQVATGDTLHDLITRYATAMLYRKPERLRALSKKIMAKARREFVPLANQAGARSADDILRGIGHKVIPGRERVLKRVALSRLRRDTAKNLRNLEDGLRAAGLDLKSRTVAELRKARFGEESRRQILRRLAEADKADLESWKQYQTEHRRAVRDETQALDRLAKKPSKDDFEAIKDAQTEQKAARRRMLGRRSFLARFENAVNRDVVDAMRQQCRVAQDARFREMGYDANARMTWITVSGEGTCPDCAPMHGQTKKNSEWDGGRPGSGWTVCGGSCKCHLVPVSYAVGNESVREPLLPPKSPRDRTPMDVPAKKTPIKLGGKNAELAKRAKKRKGVSR